MKLGDDEVAEIFHNGTWTPICGHYFWDNSNGAKLFCQKLGYQSGQIDDRRISLPRDGIRIGKCNQRDIWPNCSENCNDKSIGGSNLICGDCRSGAKAGIKINCCNVKECPKRDWSTSIWTGLTTVFGKSGNCWYIIFYLDEYSK